MAEARCLEKVVHHLLGLGVSFFGSDKNRDRLRLLLCCDGDLLQSDKSS
jgi:hypothetical protein